MNTSHELKTAQLPNGDNVKIKSVKDSLALVVRLKGRRKGTRAICSVRKLKVLTGRDAPQASAC